MNETAVETRTYAKIRDLPREEYLTPGTAMCGGCGGLEALRLAYKVLGERTVIVNAAGCMTLLSIYPFTPFRGSFLYTTMGSAAAGAQGVRDALDVLMEKGRIDREKNLNVVVVAGDGSTFDIGMASNSGALYRGLDFWYFCYDNEAYGNTGMQASSSTPVTARTTTTGGGELLGKKNIFEIWRAHRPAYLATVSPRHPVDLANKFEKAKAFRGPKMFLAFSPCPTGWSYDPSLTPELAKLAVDTGVWALKECVDGVVTHTHVPRRRKPVEEYLKGQGRFAHLFRPEKDEAAIAAIQRSVDAYWEGVEAAGARRAPASSSADGAAPLDGAGAEPAISSNESSTR